MKEETQEVATIPAKYIFLDVVGFTHGRSVEAQSDIVHVLNDIVVSSIKENNVSKDKLIFLPTGDGLCIVLLNLESPYDIHLLIALSILKGVHEHNQAIENEMRKFQVRIGINSNIDNLVTDINSNQNIAGAGISVASRIMGMADGNQVLVGESVFDTLRYREKYMSAFQMFQATVKHGVQLPIYQYKAEGHVGLNLDIPQSFQSPIKAEPELSRIVAYYFAHAIKNRGFLLKTVRDTGIGMQAGIILLWFLAVDSRRKSEATEFKKATFDTYKAGEASFDEQFNYYHSVDIHVKYLLADLIQSNYLDTYVAYFERGQGVDYRFINNEGIEKLEREWTSIWNEFGF